ncbi:MAG: aminoacyl-histidine dipeptidase [Defluviitaleaceae bacterium]|nr:aminoacyl-histidine dipeptidase [Defluviitaleaceae bacterium]
MILQNHQPQAVLKHFEAISQIPRGSGNEQAVSDYINDFAKNLGLKTVQDNMHNLIIYKGATPGYESHPPVILQAHTDMVCEKNADVTHDFLTDPLKLYVDGDFIKAQGTTLGADNGIAVAMYMALLEAEDVQHPPLEIVLTVEEETGMGGAQNLDYSLLKGRRMVNLDSTKDTEFTMGCAAGSMVEYMLETIWRHVEPEWDVFKITVKGLTGGHSGDDIEKERGNAIVILGEILGTLYAHTPIAVASINGGMKVNAIPREATATIAVMTKDVDMALGLLEKCRANFAVQYRVSDKNLDISWEEGHAYKVMDPMRGEDLIASLSLLPNGVQHMSTEIAGLVNASCNIGVIETNADGVKISAMPRGAARFYNEQMEVQIGLLSKLTTADVTFIQRSPAWDYNPDSALLKAAQACYAPVFGKAAEVSAIHAGLECGLFADKLPGLDIISFGPTNIDLHTPEERLSIASTAKTWAFLQTLLKAL